MSAVAQLWGKETDAHRRLVWWCPGCKEYHGVPVMGKDARGKEWQFNGSLDAPTLSPSVLIQWDGGTCHIFMRDGQIEFLGDCTHEFAGKTVAMEPEK